MDAPTIDQVREAKQALLNRLRGYKDLAGIGIGRRDGRLVVQVNWRALPPQIRDLDRIGDVEIAHRVVGNVGAQGVAPTDE